jgi:hypothetical protein
MRLARHIQRPFEQYVKPEFAGKPIAYLEIGVFEGATTKWMLQNVLTHSESRLDVVDPWAGYEAEPKRDGTPRAYTQEQMDACYESVRTMLQGRPSWAWAHRISSHKFWRMCRSEYDLIFVDGMHTYENVLNDALGAYGVLKCCGWIVFDDVNLKDVSDAVVRFTETIDPSKWTEVYSTRCQRCLKIEK